jgi:hypothetical protein
MAGLASLMAKDIKLWYNDSLIDFDAPFDVMQTATSVSLSLENQNNGHKDDTILHTATDDPSFCPVRVTIRRLDHLRGLPSDTPLASIRMPNRSIKQLRPAAVQPVLRAAAFACGLTAQQGYDHTLIGSHSIRASGAMALKLNGADDLVIKKLGRWSSDTFQRYIRPQIGNLMAGLASLMAIRLSFHNTSTPGTPAAV